MAKWGEGDPRWIVEERPDATNVNNWHWTEKNATFWSRERFFALFKKCRMEFPNAYAEIVDVQINDGEASANNRKGKLFFFYEWSLTLKWEGRLLNGSGSKIDGKLNIPNLSDEHSVNEIDIITELNESTDEGEMLKQLIHASGRDKIREVIQIYINELKEEFSKGLILPMKNQQTMNVSNMTSGYNRNESEKVGTSVEKKLTEKKTEPVKKPSTVTTTTTDSTTKPIELVTLKSNERFKCDTEYLFRILTNREMTQVYTRGPIEFQACENGRFSLFGGNITGHFEKITPNVEIVQKWRYKAWPSNVYSTVTMRLVDKGDEVELQVEQKGVPKSDSQNTANNWTKFYWNAIRSTFGLGVNIHHQ